jgi:hypothetical protein
MEQERRKYKRIKKMMAVQIDDSYGMLIDLSKGGMRLIPDVLPKRFNGIRISFITENGELIELLGKIARIVDGKEKDGKHELALSIAEIPETYAKYIDALEKDESPSGIFHENVRQDLITAVLEGKEEDLSIPKNEMPETYLPTPQDDFAEEIENIPLEDIFEGDLQSSSLETIPPEQQGAASDETAAPEPPPPAPQEFPPQEIINIDLEEEFPVESQPEARGIEQPQVQKTAFDETIVMPKNRLPFRPSKNGTKKKGGAAPQRVEVSFEEFLQRNPQFNQPLKPPSLPVKPPIEDKASLDKAFSGKPQADAPVKPPAAPPAPPVEDEQSLDKVFQVDQQPDIPTSLPPEDDLSLDGIFSDQAQPTPPKAGEVQEDDTSLDKIFSGQERS